MKVAAFTQGYSIPSARFRVRQYIPLLHNLQIEMTEFAARWSAYPPAQTLLRPVWAAATLTSRLPSVLASYRFDLTLLQREFLSTTATLEGTTRGPRVFDVDDAIWAHPRGRFAELLARRCDSIICGNIFLAEQFGRWNSNITIIPTGVDSERFHPIDRSGLDKRTIIGWSSTSSSSAYLETIEAVLAAVLRRHPQVCFRIVSDRMPDLPSLPEAQVEFIPWSPDNEVATIQSMDIGIMPLMDTIFARGKCSYKMLLYMACGIPVIVSPVGMNNEVLALGRCGLAAATPQEWNDSLETLLGFSEERAHMGQIGRQIVETYFSISHTGTQLAHHLQAYA